MLSDCIVLVCHIFTIESNKYTKQTHRPTRKNRQNIDELMVRRVPKRTLTVLDILVLASGKNCGTCINEVLPICRSTNHEFLEWPNYLKHC